MSTCFKCGTDNEAGLKYCGNCNALLPKQAPTGIPNKSTMDLNESIEYPRPDSHYKSPYLEQLAWAVHDFLEEGAEIEAVVEGFEAYKELFENFQKNYPELRERSYENRSLMPKDPFPSQFNYYLLQTETFYGRGKENFESYFDQFEEFLDKQEELEALLPQEGEEETAEGAAIQKRMEELQPPPPELLIVGVRAWLECNDNVCMALEALAGWLDALQPLYEEATEVVQAAAAAAAEGGSGIPSDATDVGG